MGDQYAVQSFLHNYEFPSQMWNATEVLRRPDADKEDAIFFNTKSPISSDDHPAACDISLSKFADDVNKYLMAPVKATRCSTLEIATKSMQAFDSIMQEVGYHQNADKLVAVLSLNGGGSRDRQASIRPFRVLQGL